MAHARRWRRGLRTAIAASGVLALGASSLGGPADRFLAITGAWLVAVGAFLLVLRRGLGAPR